MAATQKFTNSGLVTYVKLSSHNSGLRTQNIDTLTPHCMAGNMTAENCANFFASDYTQASSQYCIGSDGHIALSVQEKHRSWCSSSNANDQRAITIEIANTTTVEPFPVTQKAWDAMIDLFTDCCQRNNIKELKWKADKSLIGQPDKQNITVHRWFTNNRSCLPVTTRVLTKNNEWVPLKDIQLEDEIYAVNENNEFVGWFPVLDKIEPETATIHKFRCGLMATGDHRLLVKRSRQETKWTTMTVDEVLDEMDKIGTVFYVPINDDRITTLGPIVMSYETEVSCVTVSSGYILINQDDQEFRVGNCPGEYLFSRMGTIAAQVNARLKASTQTISNTSIANKTSKPNDEYIWSYLRGKQFNPYAVSAIMGCMQAESGFIPNNLENTKEKILHLNDEQYTTAVDKGAYPNFATDKAGYGLCQWTYDLGKKRLLDFARQRKKSVGDLYTQCEFFWWDINTNFAKLKTKLVEARSIEDALRAFLDTYEYGGHAPDSIYNKRLEYAKAIYKKFNTSTTQKPSATVTPKCPYAIRVEVNELRIREKPSTAAAVKGSIKDRGAYTIIATSTGQGAKLWGKLKSGAGWIALDYTKFIKNL